MTYFAFLAIFLVAPIFVLLLLVLRDRRRGRQMPASLRGWPLGGAILLLAVIALLYSTPWDNYLVATRVWWYDPALVTGLTLAWVPVEEYTFFILQPILGGLWLAFWAPRVNIATDPGPHALRKRSVIALGTIWLLTAAMLISGWQPGTYLALELIWALPPIVLQLAFGADILWRYRRLIIPSIAALTLYLSAADALAINWGTWTINPEQSLNFFLGGVLPVEEFLFFFLTNCLVIFGIVLVWAQASHERLGTLKQNLGVRLPARSRH